MDHQNQNQNENRDNQSNQAGGAVREASGASSVPSTGADELLTLMGQSSKTCTLGKWMKGLRKPGLSLQYSLDKRHIPDMDGETAGKSGTPDQSNPSAPIKGANADVMTVKGGFTLRYFDLAAGMLLLMVAGCFIKGCCCLKRMM